MAKQEKKNELDKDIDYISLIEQMNDEVFEFCVEYLYPMFDFKVIKQEEMRKIDLEEVLVRFRNQYIYDMTKMGYLNFYLSIIRSYFDNVLKCEEDSRAARCKKRGYEVLENALKENGTQNDILDALIIFLSLFREIENNIDDKEFLISDVSIKISKIDAEVLNDLMYDSSPRVTNIFAMLKKQTNDIGFSSKVLFINSIVFLCIGLQERGFFNTGEEE